MAKLLDDMPPRAALVSIAADFYARGWMAGTAGNLSARVDAEHFWITASGKPKGHLEEADYLLVRITDGHIVEHGRAQDLPSAETAIHRVIYSLFPETRAVLHGHSIEACLAGELATPGAESLALPPLEMLKGFDIWDEKPKAALSLFENHLDVHRIARDIERRFHARAPDVSALLVRTHGATVWGASAQEAYDRFEVLDFLLTYLTRRNRG